MRAFISLKMDRPIDRAKHYISPGGYEFLFEGDTKPMGFDFNESYGFIDREDPSVIHFELRDLDTESFDCESLPEKLLHGKISKITEFYIYVGDNDGDFVDDSATWINAKSVVSMDFEIYDQNKDEYVTVPVDESLLKEVWANDGN